MPILANLPILVLILISVALNASAQIFLRFSARGGIGTASLRHGGISVAALVACNALGDVIDPDTALPLAGSRRSVAGGGSWRRRPLAQTAEETGGEAGCQRGGKGGGILLE